MSSFLTNTDLALENIEERESSDLPDCDTEFQHFSETVSQLETVSEPLPFGFGDTPLSPLEIEQERRLERKLIER